MPEIKQDEISVLSEDKIVKVTVEFIGEGGEGDYDPENPQDEPLLRFGIERLYKEGEKVVPGFLGDYDSMDKCTKEDYYYVRDSSYCCNVRADTSRWNWERLGKYILAQVEDGVRSQTHEKRLYETLSWTEQADLNRWEVQT